MAVEAEGDVGREELRDTHESVFGATTDRAGRGKVEQLSSDDWQQSHRSTSLRSFGPKVAREN